MADALPPAVFGDQSLEDVGFFAGGDFPDDGGGGAVGFQAAVQAAGAHHAVLLHDHVARLEAAAVAAPVQAALVNEAAAHAGA